ncbi:uncharacterized protein TrAFT101_001826 [Trichoderma asperellum]|uniref:uncharacterized protein n=1 Tax=Trichoderma asperellum TaxID=101201 RepID=UPI0033220C01|nr:hypothetical protein TrAFT101_001826 [Trichoderma asperellum]
MQREKVARVFRKQRRGIKLHPRATLKQNCQGPERRQRIGRAPTRKSRSRPAHTTDRKILRDRRQMEGGKEENREDGENFRAKFVVASAE